MKQSTKKLFSIILISVMLIASHLNIVAATTENNTSINTLEETIINQAMTLNESKEMNNRNFNIISLSDNIF